jgi:DHA2 family multidrug resistance protein
MVDPRYLVGLGLAATALSLYQMTFFSPDMNYWPLVWSGIIQGFGLGFVFIPLSTIAFSTLDPRLRTDATSFFNLVRNLGSSIGVSVMAATLSSNIQTNHAELGEHINLFNPNVDAAGIVPAILGNPAGLQQAAQLDGLINLQSAMISYLDDFKLMFLITLCAAPLLLLLRYKPVAAGAGAPPVPAVHAD